ncbi:hypothetical protein WA026_021176 [Henosepilachna vigintioctopunctata]|uniref:Uncharacterized protein n=1 Tax=Henosepilachna vigintioctopunctata TaxID=420089 RepID=A0AAW1UB69_9CUCU
MSDKTFACHKKQSFHNLICMNCYRVYHNSCYERDIAGKELKSSDVYRGYLIKCCTKDDNENKLLMINETLRKTIDELNTQREYTEANVSALKEEVCKLGQDNEALMERILNLDKENNSMKMIIEENYDEEFRKMEVLNGELNRVNSELKEENETLAQKLLQQQTQKNNLMDEYLETEKALNQRITLYSEKNEVLHHELTVLRKNKELHNLNVNADVTGESSNLLLKMEEQCSMMRNELAKSEKRENELKQKINELAEERRNMLTSIEVLSSENSVYQREQSAGTQLGPSQETSDEFELRLCHRLQDKLYSRLYERIRSNILNELKERQCSQPCSGGDPNQCSQEKDGVSISEMRQREIKVTVHDGGDERGRIQSDLDVAMSRGAGSLSVIGGSYAQVACSESKGKANKLIAVSGGGSKPGVYADSSYGSDRMLRGAPSKKKSSNGLLNGESVLRKHSEVAMSGAESVQPGELLEGRSPCDTPVLLQTDQWNTVSRKKQKSKSLVGTGGGCNILIKGVKQLCHTHVCKLSPDLTAENIIHHLNKNNLDDVRCVKLSSKRPEEYSSFRVSVPVDDKNKIRNPDIWPLGVRISPFLFRLQQVQRSEG